MTLFPSTIAVVAGSLPFGVNPPLLRCCRYRFRSYSGSLLADAPKVSKRSVPLPSGPTSSGSLAPSSFQGHAAKGHPWPIAALAASMPLNPLHNDSTRPPDGAFGVACEIGAPEPRSQSIAARPQCFGYAFWICLHGQFRRLGFRIPSGGRVEVLWRGAFGMDAKRGTMGQGWPTVTTLGAAPERGKFRAAKPGCRARFLFGYFLFRASKEKVTRRKGEIGIRSRRRKQVYLVLPMSRFI